MGYLSKFVVACALVAAVTGAAPPPDPVAVEVGIGAGYDAQCAALMRGDARAWAATLAPDFVPTMTDGTHGSAKSALDGVTRLLASAKIDRCRILPESITMMGDDAIAVVAVTMSGTQADGKAIAVEQHAVDRWAPAGPGWLQKSSIVSEQTVYIDGLVVQHDVAKGNV
jgi:hypothetical protein